jgi:hypothetical protein
MGSQRIMSHELLGDLRCELRDNGAGRPRGWFVNGRNDLREGDAPDCGTIARFACRRVINGRELRIR